MKRRTLLLLVAVVAVVAAASILLFVSTLTFNIQGAIGLGASLNATTVAMKHTAILVTSCPS